MINNFLDRDPSGYSLRFFRNRQSDKAHVRLLSRRKQARYNQLSNDF